MQHMSKTNFALMLFVGALTLGFLSSYGSYTLNEGFVQQYPGSPLDAAPMGPYDSASGGWMSSEHMPVGSIPQNSALEENKLMLMVGNEIKPECCPSSFSSDAGCVCLSGQDKKMFGSRGGNK